MNTSRPSPSAQFSALLSRFPAEIVALVKQCLLKLRRAVPYTHQIVYDYSNSLVVSLSMSERGYEAIVAIAIFPDKVRLYLDKSLPDPNGLLEGSGSKVRSLGIASAADLDSGDIKALIKAAVKHAGAISANGRKTQIVIKPDSKKRKPQKKTASTRGKARSSG